MFGTTGALLGGVKDADSAAAALPKLEAASGVLDEVVAQFQLVPEGSRGPLAKVASNGIAKLKPLADTVLNKEGVGSVIGSVVNTMMDNIKGMIP